MRLHPRRWRYGYAWVTLGFFIISIIGHWLFGWLAYVGEQASHGQPVEASDYVVRMLRETFENWQSEFLQLLWQVGGLAVLLHLGSPQSKEGADRLEEKVDALLRLTGKSEGEALIAELDHKFARQPDDPPRHRFEGG
jgi:hypothetical protein